jgi:hypothetical protein
MQKESTKSCPSSVASPGATLLGMVNDSGVLGYIETPVEIDESFIEQAGEGAELERSFRFSSKCIKTGCGQWQDGQCGVIKKVMSLNPDWHLNNPQLPSCSIRPTCRWFSQEGANACSYCPYVVTNMLEQ